MTKYTILLAFLFISGWIVKTPAEPKVRYDRLESLKTQDKGPVLDPLRPKPYQKNLLLADSRQR